MEIYEIVLTILKIILGAVTTAIPLIITIIAKSKKIKDSKTLEEKTAALNDITSVAKQLIVAAEQTYAEVDKALKTNMLGSAGVFKKDSVLSKLESYSSNNGYSFTSEELSNIIEKEIEFTKAVNSNK